MSQATIYTFSEELFSDLHKDAYGFRPNQAFWEWIQTATNDEKQQEWDGLCDTMSAREQERIDAEAECVVEFEANVTKTMGNGAADRATAIKWMMAAEEHVNGDVGYFEYLMGIPYGYIAKHP
jgi:hypothetical protein